MKLTPDAVKQFVALRDDILAEREQLIARLREMDQALGAMGLQGNDNYYGPRPISQDAQRKMTLKEAVLKVVEGESLTKQEILEGVVALGYEFKTKVPMNSLSVILYGKSSKLKNERGRFSL